MSEFSVNIDRITSIVDLLERQANALEDAGESIDSIKNSLNIQGSARTQVMSAMKTTSNTVREEASTAARIARALKEIASSYRSAENSILGSLQSGSLENYISGSSGEGIGGSGNGTQNGNDKNSSVYSSDPVNLNTGNFILDNHDMEIPGFQPLVFRRFYNSMSTFTGMLGKDWNTGFEMKISLTSDSSLTGADASIVLEDGREEYFVSVDGKSFLPAMGTTAKLIYQEDRFIYQTLDGDSYYFDKNGSYLRFENAHKVGFDLIYRGSVLERVEKDSGEFFAFSYDENGFLSFVEDHTGRTCQYLFEGGHLAKVILPDGSAYQYFYNQSGKISRVMNPRQVDAVETEYDDFYRVTFQRFADGTTNLFEYQDAAQAVVMTERNGSKSIHYHNEKYQNTRNVYLDGEEYFEYNERGQKTVITDRIGNVTRLQYDNRGNVTKILMTDGTKIAATYNYQNRLLTLSVNGKNKVRNQYNSFGDLISKEDGLRRRTTYCYDEYGRTTEVRMPDGSRMSANYDERGNLSAVKNADGGIILFEYDELNQLVQQTNALGQKHAYLYDERGRIVSEIRADGCSKQYLYDEWGNVISVKDYDGSVVTTIYNENNRPIVMADAAGRQTYFEYDSMWNIAKTTLPNGGVFQYAYDENNRLKIVCDAEGNETHYKYDSMGNILTKTNAEGAETHYVWDTGGRCVKVMAADGTAVEYGYNEDDQIVYVKDAGENELFRTFDEAGQLIAEKDSLGRTRSYTYNAAGDLISVLDEKGEKTFYQYTEGLHKIKRILYPNGTEEQYSYDVNGNLKTYTDIYGNHLYYKYDELNRLIILSGDHGELMEYRYDIMGRILSEKDFKGNITRYQYSVTGQLLAMTDALGNVTRYSYNDMDELVGILKEIPDSDECVNITYERDRMGQITKITDALGKSELYQYNRIGAVTEKTDRSNRSTKYSYNNVGLLQSVRWADGKEAVYRYNPLRRLSEISDWTGVTRIEYDGAGSPVQITYPDQRTLMFGYDSHGNRTQMSYPDGSCVSYEYDTLNRLEKVIRGEFLTTYTYDRAGNLASRSLSDGSEIQYQYNAQGLLSRMTHSDAQGILDDFSFGYDLMGRRKQYGIYRRDDSGNNGIYEYAYDPVGRLLQVAKDRQVIREYSYNVLGNRSSMASFDPKQKLYKRTHYEYDLRGGLLKLTKAGIVEEYKYDECGNLTELARNGQNYMTYHYDAVNRLALAQSSDGKITSYQYNGLGYRTGMQTMRNGKKTTVSYALDYSRIYDNLLEEKKSDETETYIWGNGLEGFVTGAGSYGWYLTDPLGSILRKSDRHGTIYTEDYDEFGNVLSDMHNRINLPEFGYNGFKFDPVAGTYFAQARQYRSYTGTFDTMDRFGGDITMPDTLNPYSYCAHDPFNRTDKSAYWFGLDDAIAAGLGGFGGLTGQFISDVFTGVTTGNFEFSDWQEYAGAAIGGAAGGVTTLYAGPIAGGAISGGVSRLTTEGLTWVSNPDGYQKSGWDVAKETALDTGMGALSGVVSKLTGKATQKIAKSKPVQWFVSKLRNGGKLTNMIADKLMDISHGKSNKWWSQTTKILKNQREAITHSKQLKNKLFSLLISNLPVYMWQEMKWKFIDKIKPTKLVWNTIKEKLQNWLKELLGLEDSNVQCAAAA